MKWLAFVLFLLNLIWAAWARDAFAPWDWAPEHPHEPERFERQLRPDDLQPRSSP